MDILPLIITTIVIAAPILWFRAKSAQKARDAKIKSILDEANHYAQRANREKRLPVVQTSMILKSDEKCYWVEKVSLFEARAVRHFQSGSRGIKIAKGVRVGQSRGTSYSKDEIMHISSGTLCVTNKRLIYDGDTNDRNIQLSKISNISSTITEVEISAENRQKSMIFSSRNPAILGLVLRACIHCPDPQNLPADTTLSVEGP